MPETVLVGDKTLSFVIGATYESKDNFQELLRLAAHSEGWQMRQAKFRAGAKTFRFGCEATCNWSVSLSPRSESSPVSITNMFNYHNHPRRPEDELVKPPKISDNKKNGIDRGGRSDTSRGNTTKENYKKKVMKTTVQHQKKENDGSHVARKNRSNELQQDQRAVSSFFTLTTDDILCFYHVVCSRFATSLKGQGIYLLRTLRRLRRRSNLPSLRIL